ncbi:MAG: PD-(D/E)XK nuclease family protein [Moorea sp. SIO3C2]|nr:PD-(D/E)XK nuclease family protein [Moorena sp. SIO3C2]
MTLSVISLSQTHLTLLETCPRRFQYIFDQSLAVPPTPQNQAAALWGNQFHRLMQQQAMGLPIGVMTTADSTMTDRVDALRQQAPQLFQPATHEQLRQSEHQRSLALNGYVFTVIYDLIVLTEQTGLIVDWKTYLKPPPKARLENDWQTRLYCYVLAETSDLPPEQITMEYWFVRHQDNQNQYLPPSAYRFHYSGSRHDQTRAELLRLTDHLSTLRAQPRPFPQTDRLAQCQHCPFQIRCQRHQRPELPLDLDAIEEVALDPTPHPSVQTAQLNIDSDKFN